MLEPLLSSRSITIGVFCYAVLSLGTACGPTTEWSCVTLDCFQKRELIIKGIPVRSGPICQSTQKDIITVEYRRKVLQTFKPTKIVNPF